MVRKFIIVAAAGLMLAGCAGNTYRENKTLEGAAVGAGAGAILGGLLGGSPGAAAAGAAVGGVTGAAVGNANASRGPYGPPPADCYVETRRGPRPVPCD
jgi:hypothetical protein